MSVKGSHRLVVGSMIAMGLVGIVLGIVTMDGFQSSASGDLVISSIMGSGISLATILVGTVSLLGLEFARMTSRRPKHARVAAASVAAHA
jgi:hypothetical protein